MYRLACMISNRKQFHALIIMLSCLLTHEKIIFLAALRKDIHVIRELKIKVFRHFLQTMNVKKSHDQSLPVRFARLSRHASPAVRLEYVTEMH